MPPTAGQGANTAVRGSAELAHMIIAAAGSVDERIIGQYEADLRTFAKKAISTSWAIGSKVFGFPPIELCEQFHI